MMKMATCDAMIAISMSLSLLSTPSLGAALSTTTTEYSVWSATTRPDVNATTLSTEGHRGTIWEEPRNGWLTNSSYNPMSQDTTMEAFTYPQVTGEGMGSSQLEGDQTTTLDATVFTWRSIAWSWVVIPQAISGIVGIVGNFLVVLVLFQRRRKSRSMDTLILALACADFLTSICIIPIPKATTVPYTSIGQLYCRIISTNSILWWSITISTYILMSISVERYLAIVYPIYFNRFITRRRVIAIVAIVLLSTLSGIYGPFVHGVDENTNKCGERYMSMKARQIISCYWFCLRIVIPCFTMLITQILIARELNLQFRRFKDIAINTSDKDQVTSFHLVARNRVIKMMVIVIIIYIVCWSPNQIAYLGYNLGWVPVSYFRSPLQYALTILGFVNSCINPIIYAARYPEFREGLKDAFTCAKPKNKSLFETPAGNDIERSRAENPFNIAGNV